MQCNAMQCNVMRCKTDPERQKVTFGCVGMSAKRRLAVSAGSFWLGSGRLDNNKKSKFFWRVWAGFLSLAPYLVFGNVLCALLRGTTTGFRPIGLGVERRAEIRRVFLLYPPEHPRLAAREERPPFSSGSVVMCLMQYHAV